MACRPMACVGVLVAASVLLAGCFGGGPARLTLSATAPLSDTVLQVGVSTSGSSPFNGRGDLAIRFGGEQVYPESGTHAFEIRDSIASVRVPYAAFVEANGEYEVLVSVGDVTDSTPVGVTKFVDSLRVVASYDRNTGTMSIRATFLTGPATSTQGAVYTSGNATIALVHEGAETTYETRIAIEPEFDFEHQVDRDAFYEGDGNYTAVVTFENAQAKGNVVTNDPAFKADTVLIVESR